MSITAYISELLEENEYVIIPGFGAFISNYQPAKFEENSDMITPPSRLISFIPDLKMDDGLLLNYLVHRMKISTTQAHKLLEQYTDDIVYRLHAGETVILKQLGILSKTDINIRFEAENKAGFVSEAFGLSPVVAKSSAFEQEVTNSPEIAETVIKKGGKRWLPWLIFLLIIALIAVILTFAPKKEKTRTPVKKPDSQTETGVLPDTHNKTIKDSVQTKQENAGITAEDIISGQLEEGLYYLIGGSFKSQKNADEYMEKMSNKGYHAVSLGKVGNFYLVALDSYKTAREATIATDRVNDTDPDAGIWIYHPE